jgi:hypothetical protein
VANIFQQLLKTSSDSQYNSPDVFTQTDADMALLAPVLKAGGLNISDAQQTSETTVSNEPVQEHHSKIKVYHLASLNDRQQRQLAVEAGDVSDSDFDVFAERILLNGLENYTKRPLDLLDLASYWNLHKKFGSLREMTHSHIKRRLREEQSHRVHDTVLSEDDAWKGSERLAAALLLSKTLSIIAPGYEAQTEISGTIDPAIILPDWTAAKRESLLRRGLFTPAAFGRIRFFHRSSIEYLGACWLNRYLQQDNARQQIESILFQTVFDVETVTPELRPSAAWLAFFDERIRKIFLQREPMELIRYGDPKSLPICVKIKLLKNIADQHLAGNIANDYLDYRAIWAFSSPELSDVIHDVWQVNCDIAFRFFLLQVIAAGKIVNCIDLVASIVDDYCNHLGFLANAVEILDVLEASAPLKKATEKMLEGTYGSDGEILSRLSTVLFPAFLSLTELLSLIEQTDTTERHSPSGFGRQMSKLFQKCPNCDKEQFLNHIADLALSKPHIDSSQRISKRYGYLANYFTDVAEIALQCLHSPDESAGFIKLLMAAERSAEAASKSLTDEVNNTLDLKQRLFWADVHEIRANCVENQPNEYPFRFLNLYGAKQYWQLGINDTDWLLAFVQTDHAIADQAVAYYAAIHIFREAEQLHDEADRLREIAAGRPELLKHLDDALTPYEKPDWKINDEQRQAQFDAEQECKQQKNSAEWKQYRNKLLNTLPQANFSNGISNDSYHLILNLSNWLTMSDESDSRNHRVREWRNLIPAFGEPVATCYVGHLKELWRNTKPERPRWKGNSYTTKYFPLFAFAGIGIEADLDHNWAKKLSNKEAEIATKHALLSGEAVPDWFDTLCNEHTDIVLPLLRSELKYEWKLDADFRDTWLNYYTRSDLKILPEIEHIIFSVITRNALGNSKKLELGIKILHKLNLSESQKIRLQQLVNRHLSVKNLLIEEQVPYFALLCIANINKATVLIEKTMKTASKEEREIFFGRLFRTRFGDTHEIDILASAPVSILEKLVNLSIRFVRFQDDTEHKGSYTPDRRDDAEQARGALYSTLLNHPSPQAYLAMRRLAQKPEMVSRQLWINTQSKRMIENAAQLIPWEPSHFRDFEQNKQLPIKNSIDLRDIVSGVFASIRDDLKDEDASSKHLLMQAIEETSVQKWLHEQLRLRAKNQYHVIREPEVADNNKPDLTIASTHINAQIAIEVKHSDKDWSIRKLKNAISKQLIDKYLRPENRRHGFLVISRHEKQYWISPKTRKRIDFNSTIKHLQAYADDIVDQYPHEISVEIVGIDTN